MILLAGDYLGLEAVKILTEHEQKIEVLFLSSRNNGGKNDEILQKAKLNNPEVDVYSDRDIDDKGVIEHLNSLSLPYGLSFGWGHLLSKAFIEAVGGKIVNAHPSYLPYHRSSGSVFWHFTDQQPFGGTLHYIDEGIDSGDIVAQERIFSTWEDDCDSMKGKVDQVLKSLLMKYLPDIISGNVESRKNDIKQGSIHHRDEMNALSHINLDKEYSARLLLNIIRGRMFHGIGGAFFEENGKKYFIDMRIREVSEI